jgi:hypothetical protein
MAIQRMGVSNPAANTNTLIFTSTAGYLTSVIATNKGAAASTVRAWVVPAGATLASQYAYMLYNVALPVGNTIESHRFAISNGDTVYIEGVNETYRVTVYDNDTIKYLPFV